MARTPITCDEARQALWPDPARPAAHDAREHYDGCIACQRFFAGQRALGSRLSSLRQGTAPAGLRQRILNAIEADRPAAPSRHRARLWWGGTGLAAAAALAVALGIRGPGTTELAMPFVTEAARALTRAATFRSADPTEVAGWLAHHVGRPVDVPEIRDARLMGGRVVNVAGSPTAAAIYELHGMPLTYFALGSSEVVGLRMTPGSDIMSAAAEGYEVAVWSEPTGLRALAAPMPRRELKAVAAECRNKALMRI